MGKWILTYTDSEGHHRFELAQGTATLGRAAENNVVLHDQCVSRRHAEVICEQDVCTVVDLRSTKGTFLNGVRVERSELKMGDVLQLGSLRAPEIRLGDPGAPLPQPEPLSSPLTEILTALSDRPASGVDAPNGAREMEKLNWLLRAARQLNEGYAVEEVLSVFLQLTLQLTGLERAFVFLQRKGEMHLALGMSSDGTMLSEDRTVSRSAMRQAIESGSKFSLSDTLRDARAGAWASIMANQIRAICCIPLRRRASADEEGERLLGLLYLDSRLGTKDLNSVDQALLDMIAAEASNLLHNAELAEADQQARQAREELSVAARIHSGLMAMEMPRLAFAEVEAKTVPCLAIGGDFYDVVAFQDCAYVTITDVSGKGVSAAIVAATLQGIIHSQFLARRGLTEIAQVLNHFLCSRNVGKYATAVLLKIFDDGRLEYLNCGHVLPLLVRDGTVAHLEEGNLIVGLIPGATYTPSSLHMQSGDRLLLTTDGLTEAENPQGQQFGEEGLNAETCCEGVDSILARAQQFMSPGLAQDDCTLVEIRYTGTS